MDPLGFIRQHSSSNIRLLNASLAMVDHNPMILHTVRPGTRYIFLVMKAIRFMNDMFPFHRKIFDSLEIPQWGRVFKYLWVLAKVKWWDKYIDWLGYEAFDDDPKQLSMKVSEKRQDFLTPDPMSVGSVQVVDGFGETCSPYRTLLTSPLIGFRTFVVPHHPSPHAYWFPCKKLSVSSQKGLPRETALPHVPLRV
jgi:hypothetical protein